MNYAIQHQMQPTDKTCFSACIAMLTGVPVLEMVEHIDARYKAKELSLGACLKMLGVKYTSWDSAEWNDFGNKDLVGVHVVAIPSVNAKYGMHQILIEVLPNDEWVVWDPQMGRPGARYFTANASLDDVVQVDGLGAAKFLTGNYTLEAFIEADEVRRIYALTSASSPAIAALQSIEQ